MLVPHSNAYDTFKLKTGLFFITNDRRTHVCKVLQMQVMAN